MRAICVLLLVGCGGATPPPQADVREEPPPAPIEPVETAPIDTVSAARADVCERAMECCLAYVGEMNTLLAPGLSITPEQACAGVYAVRDIPRESAAPACEAMIDAWHQALEQAQRSVPAACRGEARSAAGPA